jgi:hypothetical protein
MMWLFEDIFILAKKSGGERYTVVARLTIPEIKEFIEGSRIPDTNMTLLRLTTSQNLIWTIQVDFLQIYQWVTQFQKLKSKYAKEFVSQTNMVQDLEASRVPFYFVEIQIQNILFPSVQATSALVVPRLSAIAVAYRNWEEADGAVKSRGDLLFKAGELLR